MAELWEQNDKKRCVIIEQNRLEKTLARQMVLQSTIETIS